MKLVKVLWKAFEMLLLVLLAVALLCNLWVLGVRSIAGKADATIFGWSWAVVLSGSMEPEISLDDLIICKEQDDYRIGDIITFKSGKSMTTHRIVGETEGNFITKGDANNTEDVIPVIPKDIVGKVVCTVPQVGVVLGYLKTPMGLMTMVLIGFLLIEIPYLMDTKKSSRRKGCE